MSERIFLLLAIIFIVMLNGCADKEKKHTSFFTITMDNNGTKVIEKFCLYYGVEKFCIDNIKPFDEKIITISLNGEKTLSVTYYIQGKKIYTKKDINCYCDSYMKGYVNIMLENEIMYVGSETTYMLDKELKNNKKYDTVIKEK